MTRLTPDQKDSRKWEAAGQYLIAYGRWLQVRNNPLSQEAKEAWLTLLSARRRYRKVANLHG